MIAALRIPEPVLKLHSTFRPDVLDFTLILVEDENITALVQVDDQVFAVLLEQHHLVRRIVVPYALFDLLSVPFQLSGLGIERDNGIGI